MKTAVAQFAAGTDVAANLETCAELIGRAARARADLVVLPEAAMFHDPGKMAGPGPHGQSLDGPFVTSLQGQARIHAVTVVCGIRELSGDGRDYNTLVAIDPHGELIGAYRKIHLYDAFQARESETIKPGDITTPLVFQIGGTTVAALTCYDLRFPEPFRWVTDAGAQLILLPAAWVVGPRKEDHWLTLIKARAIENTVYVAAAGQTGPVSCGGSVIVDPMGVIVADAGEPVGAVVVADIDLARIGQVRETNPSLANRRFSVIPTTPVAAGNPIVTAV